MRISRSPRMAQTCDALYVACSDMLQLAVWAPSGICGKGRSLQGRASLLQAMAEACMGEPHAWLRRAWASLTQTLGLASSANSLHNEAVRKEHAQRVWIQPIERQRVADRCRLDSACSVRHRLELAPPNRRELCGNGMRDSIQQHRPDNLAEAVCIACFP